MGSDPFFPSNVGLSPNISLKWLLLYFISSSYKF